MSNFGENTSVSAFHITQRASTLMNKEHLKLSRDACRNRKPREETVSDWSAALLTAKIRGKTSVRGTGAVAQWLKPLAAPAVHPCLVPSTYLDDS